MTIKCPKGQHEGFSKKLALSAILYNMKGLMWGWQCTCSENQTAAAFLALINTTMVLPAHVSVWAVRCIYLQTSMFQWNIVPSYNLSPASALSRWREKVQYEFFGLDGVAEVPAILWKGVPMQERFGKMIDGGPNLR